jgi:dTDP-4-dehydrorhamnose 3,5-epimerase-like enzyme
VASDEDSIIWNDRDLGIDWPLKDIQGEPLLSGKDAAARAFIQP